LIFKKKPEHNTWAYHQSYRGINMLAATVKISSKGQGVSILALFYGLQVMLKN
jgi:hypothetical protein